MSDRSIIFVHAHPDDECMSTGGTIARYATEGAHVCLVTCTNGEEGEIAEVPELGPPDEIKPRLGEVRLAELRAACDVLGVTDLRPLGFHDSGMEQTPENDAPHAFIQQPLDEPVAAIEAILREVKPQVLVTYNEYGLYGHPDHIRAHEAALAAVERAADPKRGEPHQVQKIYYTALPKGWLRTGRELAEHMGMDPEDWMDDETIERMGTDDELIAATVDVTAHVDAKFAALAAHRTQLGTTQGFLSIPEDVRVMALGVEYYVLARSTVVPAEGMEADLFERVT